MPAPKGHKFSVGNNGGRPPVYETAEQLIKAIDSYIEDPGDYKVLADETKMPLYTITGLTLHLGFASRQSLYDYEKNEKFSCIIRKARTFIEKQYEIALHFQTCTGAIFALKNMDWKDNQTIEHSLDANKPEVNFVSLQVANINPRLRKQLYEALENGNGKIPE